VKRNGCEVAEAPSDWRFGNFVSLLFEKLMNEGICGRFGRNRRLTLAYRPTRGAARVADR
jgi:hypothetical protein